MDEFEYGDLAGKALRDWNSPDLRRRLAEVAQGIGRDAGSHASGGATDLPFSAVGDSGWRGTPPPISVCCATDRARRAAP